LTQYSAYWGWYGEITWPLLLIRFLCWAFSFWFAISPHSGFGGPVSSALPVLVDAIVWRLAPQYWSEKITMLAVIQILGTLLLWVIGKRKEIKDKESSATEQSGPSPFFSDPPSTIRRRAPYED